MVSIMTLSHSQCTSPYFVVRIRDVVKLFHNVIIRYKLGSVSSFILSSPIALSRAK